MTSGSVVICQENEKDQEKIVKGFEEIGLGDKVQSYYPGAEKYATQFKRCSVLRDVQVGYTSSATSIAN